MLVNPYLMFNGNCAEALKFYEKALGAKIEFSMPFAGSPAADTVPADFGNKILHATILVGDTKVMASDAPPGHYQQPQGISVSLSLDDPAKGEAIFNALSENGQVQMPYQPTFWAAGFGMCTDRFGIPWMVNVEQAGAHSSS
jgi:PhnB protein